jgi:hypothetical protein
MIAACRAAFRGAASIEEQPMPRPIHFEIHAENVERAIAFYRELLGWEFSQWGKEPYWLVKTGEKGTPGIDGGLMPRRGPGPADMQAVNAFVCTVDVANLDAMVKRVTELRGSIALPKMPIPTVGWLAYAKDTEGNLFGMMQMDANAK